MRIAAVIPARGGSRRLPRKNITPLMGKPLVAWSIDAARRSRHVGADGVWVSTDDDEIATVAGAFGASVIRRDEALAADHIWTEPVIQHAVETIEATSGQPVDIVVWMNASVPEVQASDIDRAIDWLQRRDLREVLSVDADGLTHSGVRVLTRDALFQRRLSVHAGVLPLPYVDVHRERDLAVARRRIERRFAWQDTTDPATNPIPTDIDWELDDRDWASAAFMSETDVSVCRAVLERKTRDGALDVLEWGSGGSTLHFTELLTQIGASFRWLSLEYDPGFFESTMAPALKSRDDVTIYGPDDAARAGAARPGPGVRALEIALFDIGPLRPFLRSGVEDRRADLDDYVGWPAATGRSFDVIFVDGRKRRRCLLEASTLLRPGGVVILHDAWRPYYRCAFEAFPHQKRLGDILWAASTDREALDRLTSGFEPSPEWSLS